MKKQLMAFAIASTLCAPALAADGTVKFAGEVLSSACTVDIGTDNTMTVDLGKVARNAFTGVGSKASATKFVIKVKECPDTVTNARVQFDGQAYSGDSTVLALTEDSGVAKGVGIELSDKKGILPLNTDSVDYALQPTVVNNLDFVARYIAKSETITSGPANSVANLTLNYN